MCLVNDAVYIAKYKDGDWTATGAQFQQPYVFKTLFSGEELTFDDFCETKTATTALYLDMNEQLPDVSELEKALEKELKKETPDEATVERLRNDISEGHNYRFVGRAGQFVPVKPGMGGGLLMREKDGKYYAASGTKGYRWMEAENVRGTDMQAQVDIRYHIALQREAVRTIRQYGSFNEFISGQKPEWSEKWRPPCGDGKYETCFDCGHYLNGECPYQE